MPERQPFIAANWKMNKTLSEARDLAQKIRQGVAPTRRAEVGLAPPFMALNTVAAELAGSGIRLLAQNAFWETEGAFTGEISPVMLADLGCDYVIIGHSERRQHFHETDATVNRRLNAVLATGMSVILCVGETLEQRDGGQTFEVVRTQVKDGLGGLAPAADRLVIAYEPVWAIGTGKTATPDQAQEVHAFIRSLLREFMGHVAEEIRIQYGGSVTPDNAATLLAQPDIDGALVGGASLKAESFLPIIKAAG
jgi:triosephosphate isomerase (TIM)